MNKKNTSTVLCIIFEILLVVDIVMALITKEVTVRSYVINSAITMIVLLYAEIRQRGKKK